MNLLEQCPSGETMLLNNADVIITGLTIAFLGLSIPGCEKQQSKKTSLPVRKHYFLYSFDA